MYKLYDNIKLKDGREGCIVDISGDVGYIVDVGDSPDNWETIAVRKEEVEGVIVRGLRKPESEKFTKFFAIVQSAAREKNCVFFLDAGDGRDFETDELEGEDLMGWLIPKDKASEFEKVWEAGDVSDDWSDFFVWAMWENADNPTIKFG